MDYFKLGEHININDFNGLVYLLRKFKRLTSDLKLGNNIITSDYGDYSFTGGLTSIGGNYIIESPVTITSYNVLKNCFYSFKFTVVDVNLSGTVNRRVVSVTGDTGDNGVLEVTLPVDLIESDEQILPEFKVDIVFDPHEYYTPTSNINIILTSDKKYVSLGETATITATFTDNDGDPIPDLKFGFNVNNTSTLATTDSNGQASYTYTGTGDTGLVSVKVSEKTLYLYDGSNGIMTANVKGTSVRFGYDSYVLLVSEGPVVIDWGDGTTTIENNSSKSLIHHFNDNETMHTISFLGEVTSLGQGAFSYCPGLESIIIPDSVTKIGQRCFYGNNKFKSIIISDSVTSIGTDCFRLCGGLIDYQLYWTGDSIIPHSLLCTSYDCVDKSSVVFTIPYGETSNYISKGYSEGNLLERGYHLSVTGDESIISMDDTATVTARLIDTGVAVSGETVSYVIEHDGTVLDTGSDTTDNDGEISISYTGTGIGQVDIIASYGNVTAIYRLIDGIFVDLGVTGKKNNYWVNQSNKWAVSTNSTGTIITELVGGYNYTPSLVADTTDWNNRIVFSTGTCVEFDVTDCNRGMFRIYYTASYAQKTIVLQNGHYRFMVNEGEIRYWRNNVEQTKFVDSDITGNNIIYAFVSSNDSAVSSLKYKNFCVYSLESVGKYLSLSSDKSSMYSNESLTLSGVLLDEGLPLSGESVDIYQDDTLIDTVTTDQDGVFSTIVSDLSVGVYSFQAVYDDVESSTVTVSVIGSLITTTVSLTGSNITVGESLSLTGVLKDSSDNTIASASIKLYQGSTLLDTVSTDSNGAFSKSVTGLSAGSYTFKAVYDGDSTYKNSESSTLSIIVSKINTSLDIDVPLSLVYSDAFNITGTLTDSSNNGINGATVKLKVGNTIVDTATTATVDGVDGVVQFTQTPVTMGTHTFQLVFEGDSDYANVDSQSVTREIGKETTVLTVTSPTNNVQIYSDESVSISGSLLTDDAEALAGKSIVVSESGTTLTTLTTDSNGAFSGSLSELSTGSHSLKFEFITDDYYATTNVTRAVTINSPTLSVTGTKSIVSYEDSETSTITATYTGASVSGKSVVFKKGSTTLDTVQTDSNGQASYTYQSTGAGDVTITIECMSLQETYKVLDALGVYSGYTQSVDVSSTRYTKYTLPTPLPSDYEVEFTAQSDHINSNFWGLGVRSGSRPEQFGIATTGTGNRTYGYIAGQTSYYGNIPYSANMELHTILRVRDNGYITIICNDIVLCEDIFINGLSNALNFIYYNTKTSGTHTVSDIIVKAL